jgi:cytochrome c oxidase subunit I
VFVWNIVSSRHCRIPAGDDPWDGLTLEWATSSPPPRHNFDAPLPPIRSYAPLFDARYGEGVGWPPPQEIARREGAE